MVTPVTYILWFYSPGHFYNCVPVHLNSFSFSVSIETTGALQPETLVSEAIKILMTKSRSFKSELEQLGGQQRWRNGSATNLGGQQRWHGSATNLGAQQKWRHGSATYPGAQITSWISDYSGNTPCYWWRMIQHWRLRM